MFLGNCIMLFIDRDCRSRFRYREVASEVPIKLAALFPYSDGSTTFKLWKPHDTIESDFIPSV